MKVIELSQINQEKLQEFLSDIAGDLRPAVFIGLDSEGSPVLHMADLSWKELAHIKTAFEMHIIRDWLGLMEGTR